MCGIAGRRLQKPGTVGADLVAMMRELRHRGHDSTGFALYGVPVEGQYVARLLIDDRDKLASTLESVLDLTREHGADFADDPTWDESPQKHVTVRFQLTDPTEFDRWTTECDEIPGAELQSVGRSLEIIKDTGDADDVDAKHNVSAFVGTHGLGHARLATESLVSPVAGHPFWARPFPDVAIVHNGQLTNYYTWRRRLEQSGYRFTTENDSELIAVWISVQMAGGHTLPESLEKGLRDFDGVFTYLLTTVDKIAMAKDRWAIKPLAAIETGGDLAIATEEQALRTLYPGDATVDNYLEPDMTKVWEVAAAELANVAA